MGKEDRLVVLTYGVPKLGKTVDMGFSFPRALFLAAPGSLEAIRETCGYDPDQEEARTVQHATERIKKLGSGKKRTHEEIVIDDFSFMAEQTIGDLEDAKTAQDKFWQKNRSIVLEFRNAARYAGVTVAINCWESPPNTNQKTGVFNVGGPLLAGKLREHMPGSCDMVLRAVHEPNRLPWPMSYRCNPDPRWITGDRINIARQCDPIPMNLAELIRATGRQVTRMWPDQEVEVETLAQIILGYPPADANTVAEFLYGKLFESYGRVRAVWSVRDALDRASIRRDMARTATSFFPVAKKVTLGGLA